LRASPRSYFWLGFATALLLTPVLLLVSHCRTTYRQAHATPAPSPTAAIPKPTPPIRVPDKRLEVVKLFNGLHIRSTLETEEGETATVERETESSYALDLIVRVRVPNANTSLDEIAQLNPHLPDVLPSLDLLTKSARVSDFYHDLYDRKLGMLRRELTRIDQLVSRHNFYDCETILELQHPQTKRRALLVQADMDVDMDGSDSDRVQDIDGSSATFQPVTSYKWAKKTDTPNPFLPMREDKLKQLEKEFAMKGLGPERNQELRVAITDLRAEIGDLKKHSYLVASTDPYVVLPGSMVGKNAEPFTPHIGDYCAVIYKDVLYPSVVGDAGPSYIIGEASFRMSKEINARASANNRPVNDLKVTYLVFPNSADKPFAPPDLDKWRARCEQLLNEIGGYKGELHKWENLIKPLPTPAPSPALSPTSLPKPGPSPAASPAASPKPSPTAKPSPSPAP
jgi:glycosyl hydrolase group 75 (putative chitosanase)